MASLLMIRTRISALATLALVLGLAAYGWALICTVDAPPVLGISEMEGAGSFTLVFSDFNQGTHSNTHSVTYEIQANNLADGVLEGTVSAHVSETFRDMRLEAAFGNYQNVGEAKFSKLTGQNASLTEVGTERVALADKQPGQGHEERCLDGRLVVNWRATLTSDATAGSQTRSLIVTLRDGH